MTIIPSSPDSSSGSGSNSIMNSSSGLSSSSNSSSSGLSSTSDNSKAMAEAETKVPLSRFLVWIALVSVIGFFLGQKFSDNEEIKRLTMVARTEKEDGEDSSTTRKSAKSLQPPLLLEQYLKEKKEIYIPQFFADSTTTANDDTSQDEEDDSYYQNLARRKQFAEFVVHPTLLVSGTAINPKDQSIVIAVNYNYDGIELAQDLLKEIRRYESIEKITVLFLSKDFTTTDNQNTSNDCPPDLVTVVGSDDDRRPAADINCIKINPSWGYEKAGFIQSHVLPKEGFDVSIVLSGCDDDDNRIWEKELYALSNSIATTCTGPQRSAGRSLRAIGLSEQYRRIKTIDALFIQDENVYEEKLYPRIVDYDVQGMNIAVAFRRNTDGGLWKWHFNEAQYQYELYSRLGVKDYGGLLYFDGPSMMTLQFPSKHSADSFCEWMEDEYGGVEDLEEDRMYCDYGYDPYTPNISIDKIYVAKSTSGENAGRGVFTSVDILEEGVMIGLETNVHSVFYPPFSQWLVHSMEDLKLYDSYDAEKHDNDENKQGEDVGESKLLRSNLHRAVPVYGEAYGFWNEPWGSVETVVCSHILTFVNHGCNGTANVGVNYPGINEFTLDPTLNKVDDGGGSGFVIPEEFRQAGVYPYSPHRDRAYLKDQTLLYVEHPPILKGEELFDNYMTFGGDSFFVHQLMELKRDCSGGLGTVEQLQQQSATTHIKVKTKNSSIHHHNHNIDIDINIDGRNVNKEENDDDEEEEDDDVVSTTEDDCRIDGRSRSSSNQQGTCNQFS